MSVEAVKAVLGIRTSVLTTAERFVLLALAEHSSPTADGTWTAWPSATTLAAETGLSREYVQACLKVLRDHGLIWQTGEKRRRVNVYGLRLRLIQAWHAGDVVSDQFTLSCKTSSHSPVRPVHTEPSVEPQGEPETLSSPATASALAADFAAFWSRYPRKVGRLAAEKAYTKARKVASAEEILAGVERYAANRSREPRFTAHPTTWLNQGRWDDETPEPQGGSIRNVNHDHWAAGGGFTTQPPTQEGPR